MSNLNGAKTPLQSSGVVAGLLAGVAFLVNTLFSKQLGEAGVLPEEVTNAILGLVTAGGIAWSVVGRIMASSKIVPTKTEADVINKAANLPPR